MTIAVAACGVNHIDLDSRAGHSPWRFEFPHVLGREFAGTIAALGPGVEGRAVGDPVTCEHQYACGQCAECLRWRGDLCPNYVYIGNDSWGGYGELVRVPARLLIALDGSVRVPIDRELDLSEAAAHEYLERRKHVGKREGAADQGWRPSEDALGRGSPMPRLGWIGHRERENSTLLCAFGLFPGPKTSPGNALHELTPP